MINLNDKEDQRKLETPNLSSKERRRIQKNEKTRQRRKEKKEFLSKEELQQEREMTRARVRKCRKNKSKGHLSQAGFKRISKSSNEALPAESKACNTNLEIASQTMLKRETLSDETVKLFNQVLNKIMAQEFPQRSHEPKECDEPSCFFRVLGNHSFRKWRHTQSLKEEKLFYQNLCLDPAKEKTYPDIKYVGSVSNSQEIPTAYYKIPGHASLKELFGLSSNVRLEANEEKFTPFLTYLQKLNNNLAFCFEEVDKDITQECMAQNRNLYLGEADLQILKNKNKNLSPETFAIPNRINDVLCEIDELALTTPEYELNASDIRNQVINKFRQTDTIRLFSDGRIFEHIKNKTKKQQALAIERAIEFYRANHPSIFSTYEKLLKDLQGSNENFINCEDKKFIIGQIKRLLQKFLLDDKTEGILKEIFYNSRENQQMEIEQDDFYEDLEYQEHPKFKPKKPNKALNRNYHPLTFMFYTQRDVAELIRHDPECFFIDGTRENCPLKNFQIIAVHYKTADNITMTPFLIMTNKFNAEEYTKILSKINELISLKGKILKADFEAAWKKAAESFGMIMSNCYFHYAKVVGSRKRRIEVKNMIIRNDKIAQEKNPTSISIRKRLEEYLKLMIFVPQQFQRNYLKDLCCSLPDLNRSEQELIASIRSDFLDGRFKNTFFIKFHKFLTNNVSESFFSQYSKHFTKKPKVWNFMQFVQKNRLEQIYKAESRVYTQYRDNKLCHLTQFIQDIQAPNRTFSDILSCTKKVFQTQSALINERNESNAPSDIDTEDECDPEEIRIQRVNSMKKSSAERKRLNFVELEKIEPTSAKFCKNLMTFVERAKDNCSSVENPWQLTYPKRLYDKKFSEIQSLNENLIREFQSLSKERAPLKWKFQSESASLKCSECFSVQSQYEGALEGKENLIAELQIKIQKLEQQRESLISQRKDI